MNLSLQRAGAHQQPAHLSGPTANACINTSTSQDIDHSSHQAFPSQPLLSHRNEPYLYSVIRPIRPIATLHPTVTSMLTCSS